MNDPPFTPPKMLWVVLSATLLFVACGTTEVQFIVNVSDADTKRPLTGAKVGVGGMPSGHYLFDETAYTDTAGNAYLWVPSKEELVVTVSAADDIHGIYQEHMTLQHNPEQRSIVLGRGAQIGR